MAMIIALIIVAYIFVRSLHLIGCISSVFVSLFFSIRIFFPVQAEYSSFPVDFRLKMLL